MPVNERTERILEAVVRGFIETGEPVSSGWLFEHYDFGIRPAMIRAELFDLEEAGYLDQPHHSAGRVPSDRAFELFARRAMDRRARANRTDTELCDRFAERHWHDFLGRMSEELGALAAVGMLPDRTVMKEGLDALIERLDWDSRAEIMSVIRDFEDLDERFARARDELTPDEPLRIFIGGKSPVTRSRTLSVMAGRYGTGEDEVLLFAIGPKRMDYERAIAIFRALGGERSLTTGD